MRNYIIQNLRAWFGYYNFDLMDNILCEGDIPSSVNPNDRYLDFANNYKLHFDTLVNSASSVSKELPYIGISLSDLPVNIKYNCETEVNIEFQIVYPNSPRDCLNGCGKCISNPELFVDEVTKAITEAFSFDDVNGVETNLFKELYNTNDPITGALWGYPMVVTLERDPIRTEPETGFDETTVFNIVVPVKITSIGRC